MNRLATTENARRDFRSATLTNDEKKSDFGNADDDDSNSNAFVEEAMLRRNARRALDLLLLRRGRRRRRNEDEDEDEDPQKKKRAMQALAHFFHECASVDLTDAAVEERLQNLRVESAKHRQILREMYAEEREALKRQCKIRAEFEDFELSEGRERFERLEWRLDARTSSRTNVNGERKNPELRYVVRLTLRRGGGDEEKGNLRTVDFECDFETMKNLSEDVELCFKRSDDARVRRIRKFIKWPR